MSDPFVIFTLPRSRSAWLSHWLSYIENGHRVKAVGHDAFSHCATVADCLALFSETQPVGLSLSGTVETGAAFAYKLIRDRLPRARLLVVQRDPVDCLQSLLRKGIKPDPEDWAQRVRDLWAVSASGVRTVAYNDLELESCARWIWEYCLELPWQNQWWAQWAPTNVQIDIHKRMEELQRNSDRVARLKEEVRRLQPSEAGHVS